MHHVDGDVPLFTVAPLIPQMRRLSHHHARVFRYALPMKRRLRDLPLRAMLSAFAGDHSLAQQHLAAADGTLLHKLVVLHYQHFADVVGMVQEDNMIPPNLVVGDVAVFMDEMLEQENGVGRTKPAPRKPQQIALKTRRKAVFRLLGSGVADVIPCSSRHFDRVSVGSGPGGTIDGSPPVPLAGRVLVLAFVP